MIILGPTVRIKKKSKNEAEMERGGEILLKCIHIYLI